MNNTIKPIESYKLTHQSNTLMQAHDSREFDNSFGQGIASSVKTSCVLSLMFPLGSLVLNDSSLLQIIGSCIFIYITMVLITGFITFFATFIFASPTVFILRHFNLATTINVSLTAGLITFIFLMWLSSGNFVSYYYILVFWGMACGYSFMKAYNREKIK